jgi:hypothetical protein
VVAHDEARRLLLDGPRRRAAVVIFGESCNAARGTRCHSQPKRCWPLPLGSDDVPSGIANQKKDDLLELVKKRQAHRSPRYFNLADFHGGFYECDFVSPWTISANNLNASLMLIGQDWSSSDSLKRPRDEKMKRIGQTWNLPARLRRCNVQSRADAAATKPIRRSCRLLAALSCQRSPIRMGCTGTPIVEIL